MSEANESNGEFFAWATSFGTIWRETADFCRHLGAKTYIYILAKSCKCFVFNVSLLL